jgi:asparagine synthase (glutamine-hydrolysing)
MCGLAGLFDMNGIAPFEDGLIRRMTDAVAHRGPDGMGIHQEPGLALGHRRLSIIDLAGGSQPMQTPDGALVIVFNGEIYNFPELRAELEELGATFRTRSDTEVLLHGWRHWNTGMLDKLRGMFAFALWDARAETLVLARDKFGKKPLHYALANGTLVFGSEIKSLLCHPGVGRALDPQATSDFFTYGYVPDPKTIYAAIRKLPPAHYMLARRGRPIRTAAYWNLLDRLDGNADPSPAALLGLLEAATGRRLISDVPLGALLSGGVDSSAIVALMARGAGINTSRSPSRNPPSTKAGMRARLPNAMAPGMSPRRWTPMTSACFPGCRRFTTSRSAMYRPSPPSRSARLPGNR